MVVLELWSPQIEVVQSFATSSSRQLAASRKIDAKSSRGLYIRCAVKSIRLRRAYLVLFGIGFVLAGCVTPLGGVRPLGAGASSDREYASNGEQIYFTATSQRGTRITFDMGNGMMGEGMMGQGGIMMGGRLACADCHGPDGRGGTVRMMMHTFVAPDIRYTILIAKGMEHEGHDEEAHPSYTEETLKQAITQGIDPAGRRLEWPMPRWAMQEADLDDLIAFLKTLDSR